MAAATSIARTVRGDGLDLAVWETGPTDAPTVVLVHGYPDTHGVWDGVVAALADRFHVVTYDVRGAGSSDVPTDRVGYDLSFLVGDLRAVVDATSPDQPVHLVGHDWGSVQSWEAVTCGLLDGRLASYTSISGPCLDHAGTWMRDRITRARSGDRASRRALVAQGLHSWYVGLFRLPLLAPLGWRTVAARGFRRFLAEREGIVEAARLPGPSLGRDGLHGLELYRRNVPERMARPRDRRTDIPVQLVVLTQDRYVLPASLEDVGLHAARLTRHEFDAGHWAPVTHALEVATSIAAHIEANPARPGAT